MTESTTTNVRGIAGLMFWAGVGACFTPLLPLGLPLAIIGGVVWALAPANSARTQQMVDEAGTGAGCGAGLAAVLFAGVVLALAGALALAAVMGLTAA